MNSLRRLCLALMVVVAASGWAQTSAAGAEQGTFNLHKFEQLIGRETYTLTRSQSEVVLKSDFKFTDRGTPVPRLRARVKLFSVAPTST